MGEVAEEIRDQLIEQDIRYRRVDASVRSDVDRRLLSLSRDLKKLLLEIDPAGTKRQDARLRRMKKLDKESKLLIRTAYSEIHGTLREAVRRIAKVETKNTKEAVEANLP